MQPTKEVGTRRCGTRATADIGGAALWGGSLMMLASLPTGCWRFRSENGPAAGVGILFFFCSGDLIATGCRPSVAVTPARAAAGVFRWQQLFGHALVFFGIFFDVIGLVLHAIHVIGYFRRQAALLATGCSSAFSMSSGWACHRFVDDSRSDLPMAAVTMLLKASASFHGSWPCLQASLLSERRPTYYIYTVSKHCHK